MKRKRSHSSSDKENARPSLSPDPHNFSYQNERQDSQSISKTHSLSTDNVQSSIKISQVFKRLLDSDQPNKTPEQRSFLSSLKSQVGNSAELDTFKTPIQRKKRSNKHVVIDDITNSASTEVLNTSTLKTPILKRICLLSVCLDSEQHNNTPDQSSCLTSLKAQETRKTEKHDQRKIIQRKHQKRNRVVLADITSISNSIANATEDTPSCTNNERDEDNVPDDDELIYDCDDDFGEVDGDLEFDVSSNESSDSENNEDSSNNYMLENNYQGKDRCKRKKLESKSSNKAEPIKNLSRAKAIAYIDEGDPTYSCSHCCAIMWYGERINKRRNARTPTFTLCCMQGQVKLPLLKDPLDVLKRLVEGDDKLSKHFQKNMRPYNMVFSFTSLGGKVEKSVRKGLGPDIFQLHGENYHLAGSLRPKDGTNAKFGQLYIADTENEVKNRVNCLRNGFTSGKVKEQDNLKKEIIEVLIKMLNDVNSYVQQFRSAKDRFDKGFRFAKP